MVHILAGWITALMFLSSYTGYGQNDTRYLMLESFIEMHNDGSPSAIKEFIQESYHPSILEKIDMDKHIAFYDHISKDFGPIHTTVYNREDSDPKKLIVQLVSIDKNLNDVNIDPTKILVVEIDIHEQDPLFLSRGLGLGALACSREK